MLPILMPLVLALFTGAPQLHSAAVSATIQPSAAEDQPGPQPQVQRLFEDFHRQLFGQQFARALETASKIKLDPENRQGVAIVSAMKASALLGLGRHEEAAKLFTEADRTAQNEPYVSYLQWESGLLTERYEVAALALDRMISRFPDKVRELNSQSVWYFLNREPAVATAKNKQRRVNLAQLGYGGNEGDELTAIAIKILMEQGNHADAVALLPHIDDPVALETLLIDRRAEPIWPQIEARVGPGMANVIKTSVEAAERAVAEKPDDPEMISNLARALRHAGRNQEVIALRSRLPSADKDWSEQLGWLANEVAYALDQTGRGDEADQLLDRLNRAAITRGSWRVNMIINHLGILMNRGRFDDALRLLPEVEASAATAGNEYARQLVRAMKYCTLSQAGRGSGATEVRKRMIEHFADARAATIDALLCAGDLELAERQVIAGLSDEKYHSDFLLAFQSSPTAQSVATKWDANYAALRRRPALAREFDRLGRDLPDQVRVKPAE